MFHKIILSLPDIFDDLIKTTNFENITTGRCGANIIDYTNGLVPLVRTTTQYQNASQPFSKIHYQLIEKIKSVFPHYNLSFNNALVEIYDNSYRKMSYHTDQTQDLANDSFICLFSCYDNILHNERTLDIINKTSNDKINLTLSNNSIILFSLESNKNHLHKIVLNKYNFASKWLGITFRLSKTFIHFVNEIPYFFGSNIELKFIDKDNIQTYYEYKSLENKNIDFKYPELFYTINNGDLICPKLN